MFMLWQISLFPWSSSPSTQADRPFVCCQVSHRAMPLITEMSWEISSTPLLAAYTTANNNNGGSHPSHCTPISWLMAVELASQPLARDEAHYISNDVLLDSLSRWWTGGSSLAPISLQMPVYSFRRYRVVVKQVPKHLTIHLLWHGIAERRRSGERWTSQSCVLLPSQSVIQQTTGDLSSACSERLGEVPVCLPELVSYSCWS